MSLSYNEYPFLKELGLQEENLGVFNGKWFGSGDTYVTYNPSDNRPIARVKAVSILQNTVCTILSASTNPTFATGNKRRL
jgi:hypothetical protein